LIPRNACASSRSQNGPVAPAGAPAPATGKGESMRTAAALLLAGFATVTLAAPNWQAIGENANGNKVFVDTASIKAAKGVTTVGYRTEMKASLDTPGGGITSMRSTMQVNCKDMTASGIEVVLYEDEAKGRIFSRNKAQKVEFLREPAGSSADMVVKHVCRK
jgi:hypothetical protein